MSDDLTTFVRPEYRKTSAGHKPIDGVQFFSYSTGILKYARISEDGQIITSSNGHHRSTYGASIIGHGPVRSASGKPTRFLTETAAAKAAIKVWRKLQAKKTGPVLP
jgi:hypothetical protein